MRVAELRVIHARIPLKRRITHASQSRTENDTLLVRCQLDDGSVGWGEGLPREYVTGETIASAWELLQNFRHSPLGEQFDSMRGLEALTRNLSFSSVPGMRSCFGNSARCALEIALLDAGCRSLGISLSTFLKQLPSAQQLPQHAAAVHYSAALTASSLPKASLRAALYRYYGFRQCKVKVGIPGKDDRRLLSWLHRIFGSRTKLRIDANEAWSLDEATRKLNSFSHIPLCSVEQPLPHWDVDQLRELRRRIALPVMLDESLCSREDAERAIERELCDAFNLRLSKCGGLIPCIHLLQLAKAAGLTCQLGCQVGETGILSAAGRHFACTFPELTAVEGSFDRLLIQTPLTLEDLTFGVGGQGEPLAGTGLGISVQENEVTKVTVKVINFSL